MLSPSLPAATMSSTPADLAAAIASSRADDFDDEPNEQLMTFACMCTAYAMPATASDVEPLPLEFMKRTGMIFAVQQAPETPVALSALAPMIPATWVPWPSASPPEPVPFSALKP